MKFLSASVRLLLCMILVFSFSEASSKKAETKAQNPNQVLKTLMAGNQRFVSGHAAHPNQNAAKRKLLSKGQKPGVIVVSCSDSRVPPEILFDRGLGDIFSVRTAGESLNSTDIGSIEYAAEHLGVTLILVLGHEKCGAVDAAVKSPTAPGNIGTIVKQIRPAVNEASKAGSKDLLERSIKIQTRNAARRIAASPLVKELLHEKKLKIARAYYDLDTGKVQLLTK